MITERPLQEADLENLAKEISFEPEHNWMTTKFFQSPNSKALVYEDENGPIMYLRMSSCLRIHIQFCRTDKDRIRKALIAGGASIIPKAKQNGYASVLYETANKSLAWFCRRYLGFRASPDEQQLWLEEVAATPLESERANLHQVDL